MDHRLRPHRQWRIGVSPVNRFGGRRAQRGGFTTEAQRGEAATGGNAVSAYRRVGGDWVLMPYCLNRRAVGVGSG